MNYLQYIRSIRPDEMTSAPRFLVSGADPHVRQTIGEHIVASAYDRGLTLFVVDNTRSGASPERLGAYRITSALSGEVSLCGGLFDVGSLGGISTLRTVLSALGIDGTQAMKVITYINFIWETERRLGSTTGLTIGTLEQYGSVKLVEWKLSQLMKKGALDREGHDYLLARYAEVSGAAADFEHFLVLMAPFIGSGKAPSHHTAVHIPLGEFSADPPMQRMLAALLLSCIRRSALSPAILIIDDGRETERRALIDLLKSLPSRTEVHMLTGDAFSLGDADRSVLMSVFPVRIYTRHEDMASCERIERLCGQVDVIRRSSSVTVDHRFRANSAWDLLLGTNKTETTTANAPVKEARFRKEQIGALPPGVGIIDCGGEQVLFSF